MRGALRPEGLRAGRRQEGGGLVREGLGSHTKQLFACSDQMRLRNLFLILHLRTVTLKVKHCLATMPTISSNQMNIS